MNQILKRIIEIEDEAEDIMVEIEELKKQAPITIKNEERLIDERLKKQTDLKIKEYEEKEKKRYEDTIKLQQNEFEIKLTQLTNGFYSESKNWEDEVYNTILQLKP